MNQIALPRLRWSRKLRGGEVCRRAQLIEMSLRARDANAGEKTLAAGEH